MLLEMERARCRAGLAEATAHFQSIDADEVFQRARVSRDCLIYPSSNPRRPQPAAASKPTASVEPYQPSNAPKPVGPAPAPAPVARQTSAAKPSQVGFPTA